jgi:NAD(P)-dependent dehydrogenase (short-subunit alcohol dehydrogenase family)
MFHLAAEESGSLRNQKWRLKDWAWKAMEVRTQVTRKLLSVYTASKAAVNAFTEPLALELQQFNVRVRLVLPGRAPETRFGEIRTTPDAGSWRGGGRCLRTRGGGLQELIALAQHFRARM